MPFPLQKMMKRLLWPILLCLSCFSPQALALAAPEEGLYWDPGRPAQAYVFDHQGDKLVVMVLSYDETGRAEWFSASGPIRPGFFNLQVTPHIPGEAHMRAPLLRLSGGPAFDSSEWWPQSPLPSLQSAPIGEISMDLWGGDLLNLEIRTGTKVVYAKPKRFNFGYSGFGLNAYHPHTKCVPDWTGEWVFVDRDQPERPAWRLHLGAPTVRAWDENLQPTAFQCQAANSSYLSQTREVLYPDANSDRMLRCLWTDAHSPALGLPEGSFGCELLDNHVVLFSFYPYNQLDRIGAWPVPLGQIGATLASAPEGPPIVGFRVK